LLREPAAIKITLMIRKALLLGAAVTVVLGAAVPAASTAQTAQTAITIDKADPALKDEGDDGFSAALGFTNLTAGEITLAAEARSDSTCELSLDKPNIDGSHHQAVTLTIPPACEVPDKGGFNFRVTTTAGADPPVTFDVTAAPKPDAKPNWDALLAFPVALLLMLVITGAILRSWLGGGTGRTPGMHLEHLDPSWSFSDSWVTNVTAAAAVLTGVFASSEVVTALLGEDAKDAMALATVGAAVALGFTGAGPVVLAASRSEAKSYIPAWGLTLAAAVTLAGATGELWVLWESARSLDLDGHETWVGIAAIVAWLLLVWYAIRSIRGLLTLGTTPPTPTLSPELKAATMIVESFKANPELNSSVLDAVLAKYALAPAAAVPTDAIVAKIDAMPDATSEQVAAILIESGASEAASASRAPRSALL
jgi:uncharacterized membrane protein